MKTVVFKIERCCSKSRRVWEMRVSRQDIRLRRQCKGKEEIRLAHHVFSCSYPQYYNGNEFLYLRGVHFEADTSFITAPLQNVFNNILLSPVLIETERLSL